MSDGPRLCWFVCVGVAASSSLIEASVLTDAAARFGVPRLLKPSRLSADERVRSVDESRSRCGGRCDISFGDPDTTNTTLGDVVRPCRSVDMSRVVVLVLSTDAVREDFAF